MSGVVNKVNKPPFYIPTMAEIEAIKWNGFNVVSTFSGCGGSCLGIAWLVIEFYMQMSLLKLHKRHTKLTTQTAF